MAGVKPLATAAIVAVGSELLTPSRVDTNSLFITGRLNELGIDVVMKAVVGDDRARLAHVCAAALDRADLVVFSGGLGPTDDDLTREAVADVLGRELREDPAIVERLRARFAARGYTTPMPENNRRQAMVPAGAEVLENTRGSAPGLWLEHGERAVVLLPGPPRELKPMLEVLIAGPLRERAPGGVLLRRVLKVTGRIESQTDEVLHPLYVEWERWAPPVAATILASLGQIELHLSTRAASSAEASRLLDVAAQQACAVLGADVFSTDGRSMEEVVGEMLASRALRIALAESCTGGFLTSRLTDVPGSSRYVERAVVTYANEAKVELLGVPAAAIAEHGAVSEPVAVAMARGVREQAGVDIGVGVTGIAGPGGGTPEKPVGTVALAVAFGDSIRSRTYRFHGERDQVKFQASQAALDTVRRMLADAS
jgi:nicotinamide-nucleotide amidase